MAVKIRQAVAVEGKYDSARLREVVDTVVVETGGFRLFRDKERLHLLRQLAQKRGLIVLTDSDAAGFVIRDYISGALPKGTVQHAYIPEIPGKERRKSAPSAEGLLGVEGMENAILLNALLQAGAATEAGEEPPQAPPFLTKARLYEDGLTGRENSAALRERLLQKMGLPRRLSTNRLLEVVNALLTEGEYQHILQEIQ